MPLLSSQDHEQVEVYCYANVARPDAITERLASYADVWRPTTGMSDKKLAELVRNDKIDILVDLTMHMSNGRPLLFAQAPVQVAWLAYPGTTGLSAMDYRLTDPYLDPPGESERLLLRGIDSPARQLLVLRPARHRARGECFANEDGRPCHIRLPE